MAQVPEYQEVREMPAGPDFRKSLILKGLWHVVNHETRAQKKPTCNEIDFISQNSICYLHGLQKFFFYFFGFIFIKKKVYSSIYRYPITESASKGMYIPKFAGLKAISATIDPVVSSITDIYYLVVVIIKRKTQTLVWALA